LKQRKEVQKIFYGHLDIGGYFVFILTNMNMEDVLTSDVGITTPLKLCVVKDPLLDCKMTWRPRESYVKLDVLR